MLLKGSKVMEDDKRVFFLLLTEYSQFHRDVFERMKQ